MNNHNYFESREQRTSAARSLRLSPLVHRPSPFAFTLIELLVVISVIAILASLIFPVTAAVHATRTKNRAKTELVQIETAIERYKDKLGHYPPDNPDNVAVNQLFYELLGTTLSNGLYTTKDGSAQISQAMLQSGAFGPNVKGFVNSSAGGGGGDEGSAARNYFTGLKSTQVGKVKFKGTDLNLLIGVPWQQGPAPFNFDPIPGANPPTLNPWRYNSSSPTNNPNSFDLWIEVNIGSKIFLISNWSKQPVRINSHNPY